MIFGWSLKWGYWFVHADYSHVLWWLGIFMLQAKLAIISIKQLPCAYRFKQLCWKSNPPPATHRMPIVKFNNCFYVQHFISYLSICNANLDPAFVTCWIPEPHLSLSYVMFRYLIVRLHFIIYCACLSSRQIIGSTSRDLTVQRLPKRNPVWIDKESIFSVHENSVLHIIANQTNQISYCSTGYSYPRPHLLTEIYNNEIVLHSRI